MTENSKPSPEIIAALRRQSLMADLAWRVEREERRRKAAENVEADRIARLARETPP